jgi:hypothetical protein
LKILAATLGRLTVGSGVLGAEIFEAGLTEAAGHDFEMELDVVLEARF